MDTEEARKIVLTIVKSIAPDSDLRLIEPDRPLREQIDLDSLDWLNVLAGLEDRLQLDIPESDHHRLVTLDSIAAYFASRPPQRPAPRPRADAFAALPRIVKLAGQTTVTLRPISADDAPLQADFVRRLSAESRYSRFMVTMRELPQFKLELLTDVDAVRHVALAATLPGEGHETIIGIARYVVDDAGTSCEFAVSVDDAWQGSGLAGVLMQTLMDVARSRGLEKMEGVVLATNGKMLKFVRQLGFSVRRDPDDRHNFLVDRAI